MPGWCFSAVTGAGIQVVVDGTPAVSTGDNCFRIPDGSRMVSVQTVGPTELDFVLNA